MIAPDDKWFKTPYRISQLVWICKFSVTSHSMGIQKGSSSLLNKRNCLSQKIVPWYVTTFFERHEWPTRKWQISKDIVHFSMCPCTWGLAFFVPRVTSENYLQNSQISSPAIEKFLFLWFEKTIIQSKQSSGTPWNGGRYEIQNYVHTL